MGLSPCLLIPYLEKEGVVVVATQEHVVATPPAMLSSPFPPSMLSF